MHLLKYDNAAFKGTSVHKDSVQGQVQAIVYPNENYRGGELFIYDERGGDALYVVKPGKGDVIFMPVGTWHKGGAIDAGGEEHKYVYIMSMDSGGVDGQ